MKDLLKIIDENHDTCFDSYKQIADALMNNYQLQVNDSYYRIVECEFYFSSDNHKDPYVHGHERQKTSLGEWYFHGSGLDITLGDGNGHGGILIRGIAKVHNGKGKPDKNDAIIGPLKVLTELFQQFGNVMADRPTYFGLVDISSDPMGAGMKKAKVFAFPRIGLNAANDPDNKYCGRPYRFVTFLNLPHREADKMRKYQTTESADPMPLEEYKQYYAGSKC